MGHYYGAMLDIYSDLTQQRSYFGGPIEMMEVDELSSLRRGLQPAAVAQRIREFQKSFDIQSDCSPQELERAASTSPGHHCAKGVGHIATKLKKLAALLGMDGVQIC